ncbi:hypothetical protein AAGS40_27135 (plasmid) [Paraburkholderia sp. PREW-6R]|uniref:hypothetical protein n=1 Tax=Paraburkholderia sp. PREW-6R TaxID=3141544 RepID=UPI0031F54A87
MIDAIERFEVTPRMSKIVRHGGIVYLCGQTAAGSVAADITSQTREALSLTQAILLLVFK